MKALSFVKSSLRLLSMSCLVLLLAGCAALQPSADTSGNAPEVDAPSQEYVWEHGYPANDAGRTYGPLMPDEYYEPDAAYDRDEMPDLLLVTSNEGLSGYVYWDELIGPEPGSVDEALESMSHGPRDLPVYTEDGTTVIGTFTVDAGSGEDGIAVINRLPSAEEDAA